MLEVSRSRMIVRDFHLSVLEPLLSLLLNRTREYLQAKYGVTVQCLHRQVKHSASATSIMVVRGGVSCY